MNKHRDSDRISIRRVGDFVLANLGQIETCKKALHQDPGQENAVHKLRVSTRRLREGLLFLSEAIHEAKADKLKRQVRRLNRTLGEARDLDVSVHLLKTEFAAAHPAALFAADKLAARRRKFARKLVKALKRYRGARYAGIVRKITGAGGKNGHLLDVLRERKKFLGKRLDLKPGSRNLHQIRGAVKKLRYDLEVWAGAGNRALEGRIERLKEYQSLLGSWHDYEVLEEGVVRVARRLAGAEKRIWKDELGVLRHEIHGREQAVRREIVDRVLRDSKTLIKGIPV